MNTDPDSLDQPSPARPIETRTTMRTAFHPTPEQYAQERAAFQLLRTQRDDLERELAAVTKERDQLRAENERLRRGLTLITTGGASPQERRAFCQANGILAADSDGIARAALKPL